MSIAIDPGMVIQKVSLYTLVSKRVFGAHLGMACLFALYQHQQNVSGILN